MYVCVYEYIYIYISVNTKFLKTLNFDLFVFLDY